MTQNPPQKYTPETIEPKWQKYWAKNKIYQTKELPVKRQLSKVKCPKFYILDMFPYPSGEGLHAGHVKGYTATDTLARYKMMAGFNVLHPMGWDAFGLPAENYALKNKLHPRASTEKNVKRFKEQLETLGFTYDWAREINTTDPEYYKWTQWIFLEMFKHGLAYESYEPINWCPTCKTGLANEDLEGDKCERCNTVVEQKPMRQWVLKITDYAEKLLDGLKDLEWENSIKELQKNWIGKSEGTIVKFEIRSTKSETNPKSKTQISKQSQNLNSCHSSAGWNPGSTVATGMATIKIAVFTTRVDTIFGCTYVVVAPESQIIEKLKDKISNLQEVEEYITKAKNKTDLQRQLEWAKDSPSPKASAERGKTGVELKDIKAINPFNNEEVPVFVADYVLGSYGTGAVMAVPAHDERDFEFAKKYNLPIKLSVAPFFSTTEGKDAMRPEMPTVRRKTAFALLKHWSEDKYLCLDWEKFNWHSGIIGGIDDGENHIKAGIREIIEETGYKNIKFIKYIGQVMHTNFFAPHKQVNRYADGVGMLFQLTDDAWEQPKEEETVNHKAVWIDGEKMESFLNLKNFQYMWQLLKSDKEECFTDDGVLLESGEFTDLTSADARQRMTAWLEKNKLGAKKINYKLKDWVFSRQRYWGEPIPIIHCDECKKIVKESASSINFYEQETWSRLLSGKKTVETRALNPEEKDRYFGNIKKGHFIKAVNKVTGEQVYFKVKNVWQYKNLETFFKDKDVLAKSYSPKPLPTTIEELKTDYAYTPNYVDRIQKDGLIAWEVKRIYPGIVLVPEKDLPLKLPGVKSYEPTGTGESPLANIAKWVNVKCPLCGANAKRETNTMPQWAGSSWYYLRYIDPKNKKTLVDTKKEKYWMSPAGVDFYVGGQEHATRHLIYARFWHKFLYDIGAVSTPEPFHKLQHVGLVIGEDGRKMSKRWGNVINPDDVVKQYGADTLRLYEMFMGPFSEAIAWNTASLAGARKFLTRISDLRFQISDLKSETNNIQATNSKLQNLLHKTIKKVTEDIEAFKFNTAISALMILVNEMEKENKLQAASYKLLVQLLAPFAPHLAEELYQALKFGKKKSIFQEEWPKYDKNLIKDETLTIIIQVNGKVRDQIEVNADITEDQIKQKALAQDKIKNYLAGQEPKKIIYIKGRLVNIVI